MTLEDFLTQHAALTDVELLPDGRLINVVVGDGALYGVAVDSIPVAAPVTRYPATMEGGLVHANAQVFQATEYVMLDAFTE